MLLPEPTYKGPENITYFRANSLAEELARDTKVESVQLIVGDISLSLKVVWIVTFYAAWSPACIDFASIFSKISSEYGLPNLKFGKVGVRGFYQITRRLKCQG